MKLQLDDKLVPSTLKRLEKFKNFINFHKVIPSDIWINQKPLSLSEFANHLQ